MGLKSILSIYLAISIPKLPILRIASQSISRFIGSAPLNPFKISLAFRSSIIANTSSLVIGRTLNDTSLNNSV